MSKRYLFIVLILLAAAVAWNYPLSDHFTINGEVFERKVPLYAKASGLLYRDRMYKDLSGEIVGKQRGETGKVLLILDWISANIMPEIPAGLKEIDDFSYNVVIRQYGTKEQLSEVFATLCLNAGIQAGWDRCYNADKTENIVFAFAYADKRWLIFDVARSKYFMNRFGRIASVHDCLNGNIVLSADETGLYKEYLEDIKEMYNELASQPEYRTPLQQVMSKIGEELTRRIGQVRKMVAGAK